MKEDYDGAEPSASAVAADNALTLARLTGDASAAARAERTLVRYGARLGQAARVVPMMMAVLARYHAAPTQVVLVGAPDDEGRRALARTVAARYLPFAVRIGVEPGPRQAELAARLPFVGGMTLVGGAGDRLRLQRLHLSRAGHDPGRTQRAARRHRATRPMTFNVEVLIKGSEDVVDRTVAFDGPEPADWTDDDVRRVLTLTLGAFQEVQNPASGESSVSLRGFSWIVTPVDGGVAIAIEIASGAVVAGPFAADVDELTATIQRALAANARSESVH